MGDGVDDDDALLPARDVEAYESARVANLEAGRGCAASCTFCHVPTMDIAVGAPRRRAKDPAVVVAEIEDLQAMGKRYFVFNDPLLPPVARVDRGWPARRGARAVPAVQDLNPGMSGSMGRLVVGVDGAVASGKSTLARAVAHGWGAELVPEYRAHPEERPGVPPPDDPAARWRMQRHYLDAESRRARTLADGRFVLDRTIASQVAHVHTLHRTGGPDLRAPTRTWLAAADIVEPDVVITLVRDRAANRARVRRREAGPDRMGTADLFVDDGYQTAYDAFLRELAGRSLVVAPFPACPEPGAVLDTVRRTVGVHPDRRLGAVLAETLAGTRVPS